MTHDSHQHDPNTSLPSDDQEFDLLVDGELDERQRRELLSGLDDRPGGWRQCALAFLEAQSWRRELAGLSRQGYQQPDKVKPSRDQRSKTSGGRTQRRSPGWITTLLGMAASFFLAIGLTSLMRDMQQPGTANPSGQWATMAGTSGVGGSSPSPRVADVRGNLNVVNLAAAGPAGSRNTVGLPTVSREQLDENWLQSAPTAIPDDIARAFQQAGHEVYGSRQVLPFRMQDGRRLMVPVDQLEIHYVDNPVYQ
jgi:hypothetical protein